MAAVEGAHDDPEPELVLASTSSYRRSLLERLGVPFRCRAPLCDEAALQRRSAGLEPRRLAETLALAKASSLVEDEPRSTIIGCDQLVSFGGRVFGKPGSVERAIDQLLSMSGQTHELITDQRQIWRGPVHTVRLDPAREPAAIFRVLPFTKAPFPELY